jgi:hypothetical protein
MSEKKSLADYEDIEEALTTVERSLADLQQRYQEVKKNQIRKHELLQEKAQLKQREQPDHIKTELKLIQEELEQIELNLESSLITWRSFQEPFWQAVRFLGLGMVIGWVLKLLIQ